MKTPSAQRLSSPSRRRGFRQQAQFRFGLVALALLAACAGNAAAPEPIQPSAQATQTAEQPTATAEAPTQQPTAEPTAEPTPDRVIIDMSQAILEHPIAPEAANQFPLNHEDGLGTVYFTFDNWVFGPVQLAGDYEMIVGAEGWLEQDGQSQAFLVPIAVRNRATNQMQLNGFEIREFRQSFYDGNEAAWANLTRLTPGDTLYITLGMPAEEWANNSTQGFGFEAVEFTVEELNQFFETGDFSFLSELAWPAIDIENFSK